MTGHTYPGRFLRRKYYKVIDDFTQIEHCYLLRYSDTNYPYGDMDEFKKKLKYHIGTSQIMTGISTNMIGRLRKHHLRHRVITPHRDSNEDIDIRRGEYFKPCNGIPLRPLHEDLRYVKETKYFGIKIGDIVKTIVEIDVRDQNNKYIRTDKVKLSVCHTPKRCNFWHCDIILEGKRGDTGAIFNPTDLTHEKINSSSQVRKVAASLISLIEDQICIDNDQIKAKVIPWTLFSEKPIGKKSRRENARQYKVTRLACSR